MIPSQTEVKYRGSSRSLAAWWPLFEGPADYQNFISCFLVDLNLISKLSINQYYFRLLHGLIGELIAFPPFKLIPLFKPIPTPASVLVVP